jgi:hypothetical protein
VVKVVPSQVHRSHWALTVAGQRSSDCIYRLPQSESSRYGPRYQGKIRSAHNLIGRQEVRTLVLGRHCAPPALPKL